MADENGDRTDFIKRELAKMSIPEEYQVARVLAAAGFATQQGRSYMGSDGKPREIDVVGEVTPEQIRPDETDELIRVWLVAEVKHTDGHPWVVLDSGGRPSAAEVADAAIATDVVHASIRGGERREVPDLPWFFEQFARPVGHSLVVVGSKEDAAYAALSQVVSAAVGLAGRRPEIEAQQLELESLQLQMAMLRAAVRSDPGSAVRPGSGPVRKIVRKMRTYAWPVLVISGELYVVDYLKGSANVVPADASRLIWHGGPAGRPTVVDVVRQSVLDDYADRAFKGLRALRQRLYFDARQGAAST